MKDARTRRSSQAKTRKRDDSPSMLPGESDLGAIVERVPQQKGAAFLIVAVGASAGGLEAFTDLLKPMPRNPGMAFVLIPHLDPKHERAMTELFSRATAMEVSQVHDGMQVKPDCVYVIPPNRVMTIHDGILLLTERD